MTVIKHNWLHTWDVENQQRRALLKENKGHDRLTRLG